MTNKEIIKKINALFAEYPTANQDRKAAIQNEVTKLYKELPQRAGYCQNCNMRKVLPAEDPHFPFCGSVCHDEWGNNTYGVRKSGRPKTIHEMRQQLLRMAKEEHLKSIKNEPLKQQAMELE